LTAQNTSPAQDPSTPLEQDPLTPLEMAQAAAAAADEKSAQDIVIIDVHERLSLTDYFVVATASNVRQVKAITDAVEERLRSLGVKVAKREGTGEGSWVLLDFVDVVVHVQDEQARGYYDLPRLWRDCPITRYSEVA